MSSATVPHLVITEDAAIGLERCRQFLAPKSKAAANRAGLAIQQKFAALKIDPNIGRPFDDVPTLRELIISFGDLGYVALYRYVPADDTVYVLAFRHQKEAGY
jgi:plasmid stabilization system protein ParE